LQRKLAGIEGAVAVGCGGRSLGAEGDTAGRSGSGSGFCRVGGLGEPMGIQAAQADQAVLVGAAEGVLHILLMG